MSFPLNFVKFVKIQYFFIEHMETAGNILKCLAFYRSLPNRNVHQFVFILQGIFFYHEFSRFSLRGQFHRPGDFKCNVLVFERVGFLRLIHHRLINYSYLFRKEPTASFFKNKNCCFRDQGSWAITLTYSSIF